MTRLNVEDLEGRALMSAVVPISAPTAANSAVVRVAETDNGAVEQASYMRITIYDALITSFKDSRRETNPLGTNQFCGDGFGAVP